MVSIEGIKIVDATLRDGGLVMERPEFGVRLVDYILITVGDIDVMMDGEYLRSREEGTLGLSEALHVVYIGLFSGLPEPVIL